MFKAKHGEVRAETLLGVFGNHFAAQIQKATANTKSNDLSVLDALAKFFLTNLERAYEKGQLEEEMLDATIKATRKYGFDFSLERIKKLKKICEDASTNEIIGQEDLDDLRQFLACLTNYSYFIVPAVELPKVKSG